MIDAQFGSVKLLVVFASEISCLGAVTPSLENAIIDVQSSEEECLSWSHVPVVDVIVLVVVFDIFPAISDLVSEPDFFLGVVITATVS